METRSTRSDGCVSSSNVLLFAASSSLESSGGDGGELGGNGSNSSLSSPLESESCGGLGAVDT